MARGGIDPNYDFPETMLPCHMSKSSSLTQLGSSKSASLKKSASGQSFYARSISPASSRAFVREHERGLPNMVPEHIRKDFHRYGVPGDGPMGIKNVTQARKYFEFKAYVEGGEYRAVTVAQFMQIYAYVEAKCGEWKLNLAEVNYYHISTWLTKPVTITTNSALFEHVSDKQQAPTWFLSHWWGEPMINVMKCLRRHYAVRGLPSHVAYWICAYANRQDELETEFVGGPRHANFFKAMQLAKFKVLLILDVAYGTSGPATPFKRTWCAFECAMCLDQVAAPLDTAAIVPGSGDDDVQIVCSGLTKFERTSDKYLAGRGMATKVKRESTFPDEIVKAGLAFNVRLTTASSPEDRISLLNCIVGQSPDAEPPLSHEKYDQLNKRIQGLFAQIYWHRALAKARPALELEQGEVRKAHMKHLGHLAKAIAGDTWRRSLGLCLAGCKLDDEGVQLVALGVPANVINLSLNLQQTSLTDRHIEMFAGFFPKSLQVLSLDLSGCAEITDGGVMAFVQKLNKSLVTLSLGLERTQVGAFLIRVTKSETLDQLRDRGENWSNNSQMADPRSMDQQSEDRQSLMETMLRTCHSQDMRDRILAELVKSGQNGDRLEMNKRRADVVAAFLPCKTCGESLPKDNFSEESQRASEKKCKSCSSPFKDRTLPPSTTMPSQIPTDCRLTTAGGSSKACPECLQTTCRDGCPGMWDCKPT